MALERRTRRLRTGITNNRRDKAESPVESPSTSLTLLRGAMRINISITISMVVYTNQIATSKALQTVELLPSSQIPIVRLPDADRLQSSARPLNQTPPMPATREADLNSLRERGCSYPEKRKFEYKDTHPSTKTSHHASSAHTARRSSSDDTTLSSVETLDAAQPFSFARASPVFRDGR
ncbi:hypothetical protein BU16DRAFT_562616 [Lophium mytilinum]|uniref:Uncharacterized protein n=1 Tax=Lophium mytilinum TaxID=390894 RepID=A0A6A6QS58_9PEZI|nr:hypothetical protein BU16DRAFT_562616 [Lophium mytilinum]